MATNQKELEIPLQTGTMRAEDIGGRSVAFAEANLFLAQVNYRGSEETYLLMKTGDQLQIIEVSTRQPAEWLKKTLFERLAKRSSGGVEQA